MASKILNNKLVMVALVVVVAAIVIYVLNIPSKTGEGGGIICKTCPCDTIKTKAYCAMRKKIIALGSQKWDRAGYYRFTDDIKQYADSNVIARSDAEDLKSLLMTEYLTVLGDTIKSYCSQAAGAANIYELENELSKLSANKTLHTAEFSQLIRSFKAAWYLSSSINNYIVNKKYDGGITQSDSTNANRYVGMNILRDNHHLNDNLAAGLAKLKTHYFVNLLFLQQVSNNSIKTCDCASTYNTSQYYRDTCNQIQGH